ncbi:hypothetical protein [Pontibacter sp. G13]|uniref:hypothetical protein n=1 Tax=Pontibacter sp. G13 TaxID=3074898 RepID=UPI0028892D3E|nr:hypothetical protein [Pontibacter sp. G13]WNJ16330.1 hypothetical protein RJD25_15810 [Pontibacter sp. G13]
MRLQTYVTSTIVLACLISTSCFGQSNSQLSLVNKWYQEQRFIMADLNDDALLQMSELSAFPNEFCYFLEDRHFSIADRNHDGSLSFREILEKSSPETMYRYQRDLAQLKELSKQHANLRNASIETLKQQPSLVSTLFANLTWMYSRAEVAKSLYEDSSWCEAHPEVLIALHENLRWMAANPKGAKSLYQNRRAVEQLPHLLSWRADHKHFLKKHPLLQQAYDIAFIPTSSIIW